MKKLIFSLTVLLLAVSPVDHTAKARGFSSVAVFAGDRSAFVTTDGTIYYIQANGWNYATLNETFGAALAQDAVAVFWDGAGVDLVTRNGDRWRSTRGNVQFMGNVIGVVLPVKQTTWSAIKGGAVKP